MKKYKAQIICGPFDSTHYTDGIKCLCTECGAPLWLSLSSLKTMVVKVPSIEVSEIQSMCVSCGMEINKNDVSRFEGFQDFSKEQQEEIKEVLEGMKKKISKDKGASNNQTHREL